MSNLRFSMALLMAVSSFLHFLQPSTSLATSVREQAQRRQERIQQFRVQRGSVVQHERADGKMARVFVADVKPDQGNDWKLSQLSHVLRKIDQRSNSAESELQMNELLKRFGSTDIPALTRSTQQYVEMRELIKAYESPELKRELHRQAARRIGPVVNDVRENARQRDAQNLQSKNIMDVVHHANVRFPIDTAMFFVVIGAVVAIELIAKNGGDPLAMQRHFESLSDPVANLSFWSFIAANGISLHYLQLAATKRALDMNHRLIFASLPMLTLPFASLVSNIVSDSVMTMQACKDDLMRQKENKNKLYTACEEAKRQWTFANKANTYIPQLLSLTISNAPFVGLGYYARELGHKMAAYQIVGVDTALTRVAGRVAMTGLRLVLGPVPAIALDMLATSAPIRIAWQTKSDDLRLNWARDRLPKALVKCREDLTSEHYKTFKKLPESCESFKEDISILRDRNQSWRNLLNSDFETSMANYSELITKLNAQFQTTQAFYSFVFTNLFQERRTRLMCAAAERDQAGSVASFSQLASNNPDTQEQVAAAITADGKPQICELYDGVFSPKNFVLTQPYPLLGVNKLVNDIDSEKKLSEEEISRRNGNDHTDFAAGSTNLLSQIQNVRQAALEIILRKPLLSKNGTSTREETEIWRIIETDLVSLKVNQIAKGLIDLQRIERQIAPQPYHNKPSLDILNEVKKSIGTINHQTSFGSAFLWARSYHETFKDTRLPEDYKIAYDKYAGHKFPTTAHYLLHEMICSEGTEIRSYNIARALTDGTFGVFAVIKSLVTWDHSVMDRYFERVYNEDNDFQRRIGRMFHAFSPGRLTVRDKETENFCNYSPTALRISSYDDLFRLNFQDDRPTNPMHFLWRKLDPNIFKVVESETGQITRKRPGERFFDWWTNSSEPVLNHFLKRARIDWAKTYAELVAGFNDSSYMQNENLRHDIVTWTKGTLSDWTSQTKNPLQIIENETREYINSIRALEFHFISSRDALKKDEILIELSAAQDAAIRELKSILKGAEGAQQFADMLPKAEEIEPIQKRLSSAFEQVKKTFFDEIQDAGRKEVYRDLVYALEATTNDLNKYLAASQLISRMDDDALRAYREAATELKQKNMIQNQNRNGVRNGSN